MIEWTKNPDGSKGEVWNVVSGCTHSGSPGCDNCYARRLFPRVYGGAAPAHMKSGRKFSDVRTHPERLDEPLKRRKPTRFFACSMGDLFHETVPNEFIAAVFGVMVACPQHCFQVLTKRPERMREWFCNVNPGTGSVDLLERLDECALQHVDACYLVREDTPWPLPNVWLGASASTQPDLDRVMRDLLATPAAVRFLSLEPLLEGIDLSRWFGYYPMHATKKPGTGSVCGGDTGLVGDSHGRGGLEGGPTEKEPVGWCGNGGIGETTSGRRAGRGRVSQNQDYGRREASVLPGAQVGVDPLQGADSGGDVYQPQEREEARQHAGESRNRDVLGKHKTRVRDGAEERVRGTEPPRPPVGLRGGSDSPALCRLGGDAGDDRRRLQRVPSDDIANCPRGQQDETTGTHGRLHEEPGEGREGPRQQGAIHLAIVGCESGPKRRPMKLEWARSVVEQCRAAGVAVFCKQLDIDGRVSKDMDEWPEWARVRDFPQ